MVDCRILNYLKIHRPVFSDKRAILRNKRCVFYVLTERITGVTIEKRNKIMHDKKIQNLTTQQYGMHCGELLHVQVDSPPYVLEDEVGLQLIAPDNEWRQRPDMDQKFSRGFRASNVALFSSIFLNRLQ